VTGLRGSAIVGNAAIPGTGKTGGLLCNLLMSTLTALPVATANGASFRGTIGSPPYGPGFGTQAGVLRAAGTLPESGRPRSALAFRVSNVEFIVFALAALTDPSLAEDTACAPSDRDAVPQSRCAGSAVRMKSPSDSSGKTPSINHRGREEVGRRPLRTGRWAAPAN
jgi:hypothetical protein